MCIILIFRFWALIEYGLKKMGHLQMYLTHIPKQADDKDQNCIAFINLFQTSFFISPHNFLWWFKIFLSYPSNKDTAQDFKIFETVISTYSKLEILELVHPACTYFVKREADVLGKSARSHFINWIQVYFP